MRHPATFNLVSAGKRVRFVAGGVGRGAWSVERGAQRQTIDCLLLIGGCLLKAEG